MSRFQPNRLRVVIVNDQELVRHAIKNILAVPDIEVIAEADDGESALEVVMEMAPDVVVMDMVYKPLVTPLLAKAQGLGLRTVDGLEMLIRQASPSFEAFFGQPPPAGVDVRALSLASLAR